MPINMSELYVEDPGAAQVDEGTGQQGYVPPIQTTDAEAAAAEATTADASQISDTAQATAQQGTTAPGAEASSALSAVQGITNQATGNTMMASDRLTEITGQDTPLMQRAQQEGILSAARRGLQNSSIAAGSAMGAMVDRASPLAVEDARAVNSANLAGMDAEARAALQDAGLQTQVSQFNAAEANAMERLNTELGTQTSQFNANQRNMISQMNAQMAQDASMFNAEQVNRISALNAQMETEMNARNAAAANEGAFMDAQLRAQIGDANASRELALAQGNMQEANRQSQFIMDMNNDLNKQYLAGAQAMDLANIQGRYNQLISTNESAARLYDSYFSSIAQTMANDKISPERVAGYVNVQQRMLESGLAALDMMNDVDLDGFSLPTVSTRGSGRTSVTTATGGSEPGDSNSTGSTNPDASPYPWFPGDFELGNIGVA